MTWSYDTALTADKDKVRLLLGDTDTNDQQLANEEITFFLSEEGNLYNSAGACAEAVAAKYARQVQRGVGDLSLGSQERQQHYEALALRLRARGTMRDAKPYAGGIRDSDKDTDREDSDMIQPAFGRDDFRVPGLGVPNRLTPIWYGSDS